MDLEGLQRLPRSSPAITRVVDFAKLPMFSGVSDGWEERPGVTLEEALGCSPGPPVPAHPSLKLSGQGAIPMGQHTQHTPMHAHTHAQGELIPKILTGSMGPALHPSLPLPISPQVYVTILTLEILILKSSNSVDRLPYWLESLATWPNS